MNTQCKQIVPKANRLVAEEIVASLIQQKSCCFSGGKDS